MTGPSPDFLPAHCDPRLRMIAGYWSGLPRSALGVPLRRDLDPLDLPPSLLPFLWMVDVEPERFRFRMCGTHLVRALGFDPTGRYYDETFPGFRESATLPALAQVRDTGEPSWRAGDPNLVFPTHDIRRVERVFMPLTSDGGRRDIVLAASIYRNLNGQEI